MANERIVRALAGIPARPYVMEPTLLQTIGAAPMVYPPGAQQLDSGEIVDQNFQPYPVVRRPSVIPVTRDPGGNKMLAFPKLFELLNLAGVGGRIPQSKMPYATQLGLGQDESKIPNLPQLRRILNDAGY
jgi:hypothetical protein